MITKSKSNQTCRQKNHQKLNHNLPIDLGKPKVPLYKTPKQKSLEKLEDWEGAS